MRSTTTTTAENTVGTAPKTVSAAVHRAWLTIPGWAANAGFSGSYVISTVPRVVKLVVRRRPDGHHRTDVLERCVVDRDEFERLNALCRVRVRGRERSAVPQPCSRGHDPFV
ncbi:hypothetical protein [Streptomyces sp. NBC_00690]|uniref:hypothetical protein n=1 Tax=Streptomyces sp. NBC_00690 TaxID=2975808 RepID=UPI002E27E966|nr:hypothetical protein [Streptomyces sp. NBC_00690]